MKMTRREFSRTAALSAGARLLLLISSASDERKIGHSRLGGPARYRTHRADLSFPWAEGAVLKFCPRYLSVFTRPIRRSAGSP